MKQIPLWVFIAGGGVIAIIVLVMLHGSSSSSSSGTQPNLASLYLVTPSATSPNINPSSPPPIGQPGNGLGGGTGGVNPHPVVTPSQHPSNPIRPLPWVSPGGAKPSLSGGNGKVIHIQPKPIPAPINQPGNTGGGGPHPIVRQSIPVAVKPSIIPRPVIKPAAAPVPLLQPHTHQPVPMPVQRPSMPPSPSPAQRPIKPPTPSPVQLPVKPPTPSPAQRPIKPPTPSPVQRPVKQPSPSPIRQPYPLIRRAL